MALTDDELKQIKEGAEAGLFAKGATGVGLAAPPSQDRQHLTLKSEWLRRQELPGAARVTAR